ncbi:hypothetical protein BC833DRAFT_619749 [Globomyces pollinis-pini]|nr:hypothetical protein BC833DRAFT_619749 [Globomyces pollinis-pini]
MSIIQAIGKRLTIDRKNQIQNRDSYHQFTSRNLEALLLDLDDFFIESHSLSSRNDDIRINLLFEKFPFILDYSTPLENWIIGNNPPLLPRNQTFINLIHRIDITRITNRILTCGLPTNSKSSKRSRTNNVLDLADFLNTRYPKNYMIWNLAADSSSANYPCQPFANQVVLKPFTKAYNLTLKGLIDICQSIHAWLSLSSDHVAVIHCLDGISKTSLVVAAYLRFAGIMENADEALDYFLYRTNVNNTRYKPNIVNSRYLQYMDNIVDIGGYPPNQYPLSLTRVIVNHIPLYDSASGLLPGVEVYENGHIIASSAKSRLPPNGIAMQIRQEGQTLFFIADDILYVQSDVQIRLFLANVKTKELTTLASFSFNTGFINHGNIEISTKSLEFSKQKFPENQFPPNFSLVLSLYAPPQTRSFPKLSYARSLDKSIPFCIPRLILSHYVKVSEVVRDVMEERGYSRIATIFGLERADNDLQTACDVVDRILALNPYAFDTPTERQSKTISQQSSRVSSPVETNPHASFPMPDSLNRTSNSSDPTVVRAIATAQRLEALLRKTDSRASLNQKKSDPRIQSFRSEPVVHEEYDLEPKSALSNPEEDLDMELLEMEKLLSEIQSKKTRSSSPTPKKGRSPRPVPRVRKASQSDSRGTTPDNADMAVSNESLVSPPPPPPAPLIPEEDVTVQKFKDDLFRQNPIRDQKLQKNFISFLSVRRANNICILLKRFERRKLTNQELLKAIGNLDTEIFTVDDLVGLQSLIPTPEERDVAAKFLEWKKADTPPLAPAEMFVVEAYEYQDLDYQVLALLYKQQLPLELDALTQKITMLINVTKSLQESENIQTILRCVLGLGAISNEEYGAGNPSYKPWMGTQARALGFKIDGLARLCDIKSLDGSWSLMSFLVDMVYKTNPKVLQEIEDELPDLIHARNLDLYDMMSQIQALFETGKQLRDTGVEGSFTTQLITYLDSMNPQLKTLVDLFNEYVLVWMEAISYFGEEISEYAVPRIGELPPHPDSHIKPAKILYVHLHTFLSTFIDTVGQYQEYLKLVTPKQSETQDMMKRLSVMPPKLQREVTDSTIDFESEYD